MSFRQLTKSYQLYRYTTSQLRLTTLHPRFEANNLYQTSLRYASADRSKVEYTLKMLREEVQKQSEDAKKLKLISQSGAVEVKKPPLKDRIIHELKHFYHGFRLLALETRVSSKYLWRVLRGATLTRRERKQLVRTVSDLFRLVPFSFFIIVPFMEFALPIFIKLFPNMLPSTFQETSKEEEKLRKQVKLRVEMAKFLQDTIEEIALERKTNKQDSSKSLEFAHFIKKVRHEGGYVSNEELLKFSKLFEDELTLDNLNMSQLRSLCRLMALNSLGSPEILRFQLNMKIRELKADDKQIAAEGGVDVLSSIDLQQACRARGMRAIGVSEERLKEQMVQWLELSLNDKVPPSLLLLSRTLYLPEDVSFTDRLKAIVQNLPDGISESTRQKLTEMEGGQVDHMARIELIKHIETAIGDEKKAAKKRAEDEKLKELAKIKAQEEEAAEQSAIAETAQRVIDTLTKDVLVSTSASDNKQKDPEKEMEVEMKDLSSIEEIIVGGPLCEAKHDIIGLKEKVIEHTEDLIEINALDGAFAETKVAKRLRNKLNSMIEDVDTLVQKLEDEKRVIQETLSDPAVEGDSDLKRQREVRIQDVIESLSRLKESESGGDEQTNKDVARQRERIETLLKTIDEDADGIVDRQLVLEVITLLEKHTDVKVSASQMASLIGTLKKEDEVASLAEEIRRAQSGQIEIPALPYGPSSAAAFDQSVKDENKPTTSEVAEEKTKKAANGSDVSDVNSTAEVTSSIERRSKQRSSNSKESPM